MSTGLAPTDVAEVAAGRVEYRWDRRNDPTVVVLHGGHMRAAIALGEELFAERGYTVLVPSRPGSTTGPASWRAIDIVALTVDHFCVADGAEVGETLAPEVVDCASPLPDGV